MGNILYAYEGFNVPVLFATKKINLYTSKIKEPDLSEKEREERKRKRRKKKLKN